ncbi:MAG: AsmA family protein [Rickettsiales bacterium]|nr:AsmA family protein [Rickettsiales bacterium]
MRILKAILKWMGILILLVIVLVLLMLWYVNTAYGKRHVSELASDTLGREVVLSGGVGIAHLWPPAISVRGLSVGNKELGRAEKMLDVGESEVAIDIPPLWNRRVQLPSIRIHDSTIHLERDAKKNANWSFNEGQAEAPDDEPFTMPFIGNLDIRNTHITYLDVPQKIDLAIDAGTEADTIIVSGKGTYLAQKFGLKVTGGSLLTVSKNQPYPIDSTVTVGYTTLHIKGTVRDPVHMEGLDLALRVKGADASELFPLVGIVLPPTPPYDVEGHLGFDKSTNLWKFEKFNGMLGSSDLSGDLSFDQSQERPKLTARFVSNKLDFKDLGPLIGTPPEKDKAVSVEQKKEVAQQEASPYVIPDVPLDASRLKAMDADVEFTGKQIISSGLPLDDFYMKLLLEDRVMKITPVKFGTADGDINVELTVDGRTEPFKTDADFQFRRLSLSRLMESAGKAIGQKDVADGYIGGIAKLSGYGKSLRDILSTSNGVVGVGMEGGSLSGLIVELIGLDVAQGLGFLLSGDQPTAIRCIIGDFKVTDGLMESNALVIDTKDTNVQGRGTVNLKGERLNIRFMPQPKDISIASLRTPIYVKGTIKNPDLSLEKANLAAKGVAAVALGVVLTPIASVLALVDLGSGEDSNCAGLIREMDANTGTSSAADKVPVNPTSDQPSSHP